VGGFFIVKEDKGLSHRLFVHCIKECDERGGPIRFQFLNSRVQDEHLPSEFLFHALCDLKFGVGGRGEEIGGENVLSCPIQKPLSKLGPLLGVFVFGVSASGEELFGGEEKHIDETIEVGELRRGANFQVPRLSHPFFRRSFTSAKEMLKKIVFKTMGTTFKMGMIQ
jgi:hypothetical protein